MGTVQRSVIVRGSGEEMNFFLKSVIGEFPK